MLASREPNAPIALASAVSCAHECPASVAWLHSTLSAKWRSSPNSRRKPAVVATSQSYWCFVGSWGLGSIRRGFFLFSAPP